MYSSTTQVNQYNAYQYNNSQSQLSPHGAPQLPHRPQYGNDNNNNNNAAPSLPPRNVNPHDQTHMITRKVKLQHVGLNPAPQHPAQPKVKLASAGPERVPFDRKADLYAILTGLEHLEGAFLRDSLTSAQYTTHCNRFLSQFKTWMDVHSSLIQSVDAFVVEAGLNVPAALNRIKAGIPATSVHGGHDTAADTSGLATVDLAEKFITTFDITRVALSMEEPKLEVENIFSYISDLLDSLVKYPNLPADHEIKMKIQHWVQFCASKPNCYYEFTDKELRQLSFDLETSYANFRKFVSKS